MFFDKKVYKINHRFTYSNKCLVYLLSRKVCGMQYNDETNDEFRYRQNNYKDNNQKSLRGEEDKRAGFFAHFQTAVHSGFTNYTEIRFIDKTDPSDTTRREDFWKILLKLAIPRALIILTHTFSYLLFLQFYQFPLRLRKMFIFVLFIIYGLCLFAMSPLVRQITMLSPSEDFFSTSSSCHLSACSDVFVYFQLLLRTLFLFTLAQPFRKLYKRLFVDCLYCNVTKLL